MVKLDERDIQILYYIDKHGNSNLDEIAEKLKISRSTIHYRLKRYKELGIIKRAIAEIDPVALGLDITAVTLIYATYEKTNAEEIGKKLAVIPGVISVYYVLGDVDFIVLHKSKDREDLKRILKETGSIEGIVRSGTHFVASTVKEEKRILVNYPEKMLQKLLGERHESEK